MSQVDQLELAVKALPKNEFEEFKRRVLEYDYEQWSLQIEKDSYDENSPIMKLAAEALEEHKKGATRKL